MAGKLLGQDSLTFSASTARLKMITSISNCRAAMLGIAISNSSSGINLFIVTPSFSVSHWVITGDFFYIPCE
ncbi:Uncharacterised protein [Vibrio cholerae]|nr:Uncharacterised protein [Vibrio cholerae]CSB30847.1 Uncharacterised protein [Vibrio cholerae]CSB90119.1 Uncharacterised protein [Vibrio cholerae]CSC80474.1 Uncharacterised protein [Vibrio cholerae]CSC96135.1 Uncharacterised protein [Vibrio cholerae]